MQQLGPLRVIIDKEEPGSFSLRLGAGVENRAHLDHLYFCFSLAEKALQSLLESLTCPPYTPTQHLEREQALAKEFAEILHFTLRFDELKVRPALL